MTDFAASSNRRLDELSRLPLVSFTGLDVGHWLTTERMRCVPPATSAPKEG